jgi:RNA polymerase sigma factor (sigma-70 family)
VNEHQFRDRVIPLSKKLYSLCHKVLGNKEDAKDCMQDVFVKLWNIRNSLDDKRNLEAFSYSVARNACLDKIRLRKNQVDLNRLENYVDNSLLTNNHELVELRLKLISNALEKLNETQQKVFVMREIERFQLSAIASELEISEDNVRVTLSRVRKKLREMVEMDLTHKFFENEDIR